MTVRIFKLPDYARQAVHFGNELAQAVTFSVSAQSAVLDGLSAQAAAVTQNGGFVLRIGSNDRCSLVTQEQHTVVGLSAGYPWAQLLALLLHGHQIADLHPSKAAHLKSTIPSDVGDVLHGQN